MKKRVPGEMLLRLSGIVLLILGIMMAFGGLGSMALIAKGPADELVIKYLTTSNITFGQMMAGSLISCIAGLIYLAAGFYGVKFGGNLDKATICVVLGFMLIAEMVVEIAYNSAMGKFEPSTVISMAAVPAVYIIGAVRNKQAQGKMV